MKSDNHVLLRDGSKVGNSDIVRYRKGATAIMRVDKVERDFFGKFDARLYGEHITGGTHAAYANDCIKATPEDHRLWSSYRYCHE